MQASVFDLGIFYVVLVNSDLPSSWGAVPGGSFKGITKVSLASAFVVFFSF